MSLAPLISKQVEEIIRNASVRYRLMRQTCRLADWLR